MFSVYRCHHVVVRSLTSIQEARGKRFQSFTGQLPRHSTRQRRQSNHSFVTEYIETTASVSYHNSHSIGHRYGRDGGFSADSSHETDNRGSSRGGRSTTTTTNNNDDRACSEVVSGGLPSRNLSSVRDFFSHAVSLHTAEALFRFRCTPPAQDTGTASATHSQNTTQRPRSSD